MKVKEVTILNIPVGLYKSFEELINEMYSVYLQQGTCVAVSINPEKVIKAATDKQLKLALDAADVRYADGMGIVLAIKKKTGRSLSRLPGCELWENLMRTAAQRSTKVFVVGARPQVLADTVQKLTTEFGTSIVGANDGYFKNEQQLIDQIKASQAEIVTVALGSPRQEKFIERCKNEGVNAIFMGVGGTYDVFTGHVKRAPKSFRATGLEWLYRLLHQPSRVFRQANLVRFAALYLRNKL